MPAGVPCPVTRETAESRDNEEFLKLWLKYEPSIYSRVFSLVPNWADADDLMQEVSLILWRRFDDFEPGSSFLAWALTVVRFQVLAFRKNRRAKRLRLSTKTVEKISEEIDAMEAERIVERREALDRCLGRLREKDRELLRLRYQPGSTTNEIARALGKTKAAVYKAISRVHSQLLNCVTFRMKASSAE